MYRTPLLALLDRYLQVWPDERACVERIRALVRGRADCFERSCLPGHVTASAWVVSADHRRVLLTHHAKLDRWLQLGGHADGDSDVRAVALREAREESGMLAFAEPSGPDESDAPAAPPLDIDVHIIPARPGDSQTPVLARARAQRRSQRSLASVSDHSLTGQRGRCS